jgi:hypothetical protein
MGDTWPSKKKKFRIDLDSFVEDVFYEMERVQDGGNGHECVINAISKEVAIIELYKRLSPFFEKQFEETE